MRKWHPTEFCENCYIEFCCTEECKHHLLYRIKETREEIQEYTNSASDHKQKVAFKACLALLDNLITKSEE